MMQAICTACGGSIFPDGMSPTLIVAYVWESLEDGRKRVIRYIARAGVIEPEALHECPPEFAVVAIAERILREAVQ